MALAFGLTSPCYVQSGNSNVDQVAVLTVGRKRAAECMFSGERADSAEHVIPRWLQRRYSLERQTYGLPNGTKIQYRHATVPVATEHNNAFGVIEERVASGEASAQELYLWALKIHIGMIYRSATLKMDIRNPEAPTFWDVEDFVQEVTLFRKLYAAWKDNGSIGPDPFGTVIVVESLTPEPGFDFVHELRSGTVFLQLGDQLLLMSAWDQADGMDADLARVLDTQFRPRIVSDEPTMRMAEAVTAQCVWACEVAYFLYRSRRPFIAMTSENSVILAPRMAPRRARASNEQEYGSFCRPFRLDLTKFGGEFGHEYVSSTPKPFGT